MGALRLSQLNYLCQENSVRYKWKKDTKNEKKCFSLETHETGILFSVQLLGLRTMPDDLNNALPFAM